MQKIKTKLHRFDKAKSRYCSNSQHAITVTSHHTYNVILFEESQHEKEKKPCVNIMLIISKDTLTRVHNIGYNDR